jgi:hypothetical protein
VALLKSRFQGRTAVVPLLLPFSDFSSSSSGLRFELRQSSAARSSAVVGPLASRAATAA